MPIFIRHDDDELGSDARATARSGDGDALVDRAYAHLLARAGLRPLSIEKVNYPRLWSLVTCVKD